MSEPAGYEAIKVHVESVADGVQLGQPAPKRRITTKLDTIVLTSVNPVKNILPEDFRRRRALIVVHSTIGTGANQSSFGWLTHTEAQAQTAARQGGGEATVGAYISAGGTINTPIEIHGGNAMWAALDSAATLTMVLTVISEHEE